VNDIEHLQKLDLEEQLQFARDKNKELQEEVKRLTMLLNGEDVIKNSLSSKKSSEHPFNKLKSSYRHRDKHK
tara:strand:+ start:791 stop:1006 length:216 start_codon:yes stop_codon:yes gene_type:complete